MPTLPHGIVQYSRGDQGWDTGYNAAMLALDNRLATAVNALDYSTVQAAINAVSSGPSGGVVLLPPGTYNAGSTPSISGTLTLGDGVALVGAGSVYTQIAQPGNNTDCIQITGDYAQVRGIRINGTGASGTGRGVYLINSNVRRVLLDDLYIQNTPSWAVQLGDDTASKITVGTTLRRVVALGAVTGGNLFVTSGCTTTRCEYCTFNGTGDGTTFGADALERGGVHVHNGSAVNFYACNFEPTPDAVCLSCELCNVLRVDNCYFEPHYNSTTPKYILNLDGAVGFTLAGNYVRRYATGTSGVRLLNTAPSDIIVGGALRDNLILCDSTSSTDDVALNAAIDQMVLSNNVVRVNGSGAMRALSVVGETNPSFDRFADGPAGGRPLKLSAVTTTQRGNLTDLANGTVVYNSTTSRFELYQGGGWLTFATASA